MNKWKRRMVLCHIPLVVLLLISVLMTTNRTTARNPASMYVGLAVIEAIFLLFSIRTLKVNKENTGPFDIIFVVWLLMIAWELCTTKLNIAHPVLVPCPENVFDTFREHWSKMFINIAYSMRLLATGFVTGMASAIILGLFAGWIPRLRAFAYPIANVMAPIPAIVISPYLVSIMPSFRSASIAVIVLGVFWPTFLNTINRVNSMEKNLLDSAKMLTPGTFTMIFRILLPYILPGVVQGLRVSVTTSLLMLNFAELMGATHGMGYYVQNAIAYANYTQAVAGIFVIGIVVTILNYIVTFIQKHSIKWC